MQYAAAVTERVQVAGSVYSRVLKAGDLGHDQARLGHPDMDQRLDLEAVSRSLPLPSDPGEDVASRPRIAAWRLQNTLNP